jgi:hypothetical protein
MMCVSSVSTLILLLGLELTWIKLATVGSDMAEEERVRLTSAALVALVAPASVGLPVGARDKRQLPPGILRSELQIRVLEQAV